MRSLGQNFGNINDSRYVEDRPAKEMKKGLSEIWSNTKKGFLFWDPRNKRVLRKEGRNTIKCYREV